MYMDDSIPRCSHKRWCMCVYVLGDFINKQNKNKSDDDEEYATSETVCVCVRLVEQHTYSVVLFSGTLPTLSTSTTMTTKMPLTPSNVPYSAANNYWERLHEDTSGGLKVFRTGCRCHMIGQSHLSFLCLALCQEYMIERMQLQQQFNSYNVITCDLWHYSILN